MSDKLRERVRQMLSEMTDIWRRDPRLPPTPDQLLRWTLTTQDVLAILGKEPDHG